jgi:hypothetical protein
MRKDDAYPPRFFSAATFGTKPRVLTIECVRKEQFENDGQTVAKPAMYFRGERSGLVLGPVKWDQVCEALGEEDSDSWTNQQVELYPDSTFFGGRRVPTISVRKPGSKPKTKLKKPGDDTPPPMNDSVEY